MTKEELYINLNAYVYSQVRNRYKTVIKAQDVEDVVNEIWIKFFETIDSYDESKGALTTFANMAIRNGVGEYWKKNSKPFILSDYDKIVTLELDKARRSLPKELHNNVSALASKTGRTKDRISQTIGVLATSNESLYGEDIKERYSSDYNTEAKALAEENTKKLMEAIDKLPDIHKEAILYAFGFKADENGKYCNEKNNKDIKAIDYIDLKNYLGVSEDKAKNIVSEALRILREDKTLMSDRSDTFNDIINDFELNFVGGYKAPNIVFER